MEITRLTKKRCLTTRKLWETVFTEDSRKFVDYYYKEKAPHNIAYVTGEEPYDSMLFCTPYPVEVYGRLKELFYIVGVATKEECRHQGKMTALLMTAMEGMYRDKVPFTFLMPADPAIYEPFDFSYIYERPQWTFHDGQFPLEVLEPLMGTEGRLKLDGSQEGAENGYSLVSLSGQGKKEAKRHRLCSTLADYANSWLEKNKQIFVKRNSHYYERQLKEIEAQNGDIFLLEKEGSLAGFFLYAREGEEVTVQEMMETIPGSFPFLTEKEEAKPIIMARIIHLEEMMKLVKSPENRAVLIDIEDPDLPQNDGLYLWEITPHGSRVSRQREVGDAEVRMTIKELTPYLFQGVFLNEIV
ncbi:MAG: GNAT family N-acetyltransferase [Lachnospiraceae bacterium]|nr:GNAT family N-acetyltransferase [Lachnospiraceae bacterium]